MVLSLIMLNVKDIYDLVFLRKWSNIDPSKEGPIILYYSII
jgi:hypothetical protein